MAFQDTHVLCRRIYTLGMHTGSLKVLSYKDKGFGQEPWSHPIAWGGKTRRGYV